MKFLFRFALLIGLVTTLAAGHFAPTYAASSGNEIRQLIADLLLAGNLPLLKQPGAYRMAIATHPAALIGLIQSGHWAQSITDALEISVDPEILRPFEPSSSTKTMLARALLPTLQLSLKERLDTLSNISDQTLIDATRLLEPSVAKADLTQAPALQDFFRRQRLVLAEHPEKAPASLARLDLMQKYLKNLPASEKRTLIASYLRVSRSSPTSDKLSAVFQNVDPVLKKIIQQGVLSMDEGPDKQVLRALLSQGRPAPNNEVLPLIENSLGGSIDSIFSDFDMTPVAAGSIGQVYRATTRVGSHRVAVKVLRPDAESRSSTALQVMKSITQGTPYSSVIDQLGDALRQEFDFRNEAKNMELAKQLFAVPRDHLLVSTVYVGLPATKAVLVSDWIDGEGADSMKESESEAVLEATYSVYRRWLKVAFETGFFHTEPHLGNLKIMSPDARGLRTKVLLDFGSADYLSLEQRRTLVSLILAQISKDQKKVAQTLASLGQVPEERIEGFSSKIEALSARDYSASDSLKNMIEVGVQYGLSFPPEIIKFIRGWTIQETQIKELGEQTHLENKYSLSRLYRQFATDLTLRDLPRHWVWSRHKGESLTDLGQLRQAFVALSQLAIARATRGRLFGKCVREALDRSVPTGGDGERIR